MAAGERQRVRQLGAPGAHRLAGPRVDQVEGAARHDALRQSDRLPRFGRVVPAPEEGERAVVQRLHAERDPVHAGRAKILKPRRLGGGGIGFEGDLGVRRE